MLDLAAVDFTGLYPLNVALNVTVLAGLGMLAARTLAPDGSLAARDFAGHLALAAPSAAGRGRQSALGPRRAGPTRRVADPDT